MSQSHTNSTLQKKKRKVSDEQILIISHFTVSPSLSSAPNWARQPDELIEYVVHRKEGNSSKTTLHKNRAPNSLHSFSPFSKPYCESMRLIAISFIKKGEKEKTFDLTC